MVGTLAAGLISLLVSLVGTHFWIKFLHAKAYGQFIRSDGPTSHHVKRGTPTMGGVVILVALVLGYFGGHALTARPVSASGLLIIGLIAGLGLVGLIDDGLKISHARSLGLGAKTKFGMRLYAILSLCSLLQILHFTGVPFRMTTTFISRVDVHIFLFAYLCYGHPQPTAVYLAFPGAYLV